ncbi:NOL1/NOP2/sun family putative RNA methylase [Arcicella aurantiaca]|uniref:NOL1/NOP2/sun family putative RNA methylase n=1 Tax=Arcicella aurantiaca TaxID=591202 RepID=A0A316EGI5_9BACT|nr:RNA methyltransferase [Arcicella aurantiaca]PWK28584.1 NOL1/NOP2/sun family putative RNA methylase [Arcicella aurantiaca]
MKIPQALIDSLQNVKGFHEEAFIKIHEQSESPTSIRLNPFKPIQKWGISQENTTDEGVSQVPWCEKGRYLATRPKFTFDPLFHAGAYYVQEASSMFLETALKQTVDLTKDLKVLDLCAAPGGKSTLINSLLTPESLLISNEVIRSRANILADNLTRWGTMNTVVTNNDPKDFARLTGFFDVLVIDAPCSGSGLFRKDPEAINEWSLDNVTMCSLRQKRIIGDVWASLKEGGTLIYSTCSYSEAENEDIVKWICEEFGAKNLTLDIANFQINTDLENTKAQSSLRFYPDQIKGEGFFIAAFKKLNSEKETFIRSGKPIKNNSRRTEREIFRTWVNGIDNFTWFEKNDDYFLINPDHEHIIKLLQSNLYLRKAGIRMGKIAGKDLIPDHELALSLYLSENIARRELSREQAISYLRRDDFTLEQAQKGWSLMTYEDHGLGWAKILPNRINNYYPKELRILSRA